MTLCTVCLCTLIPFPKVRQTPPSPPTHPHQHHAYCRCCCTLLYIRPVHQQRINPLPHWGSFCSPAAARRHVHRPQWYKIKCAPYSLLMWEASLVLVALVFPDMLGVTVTAGGWLLYKHFWDVVSDPFVTPADGPERSGADRVTSPSRGSLVFKITPCPLHSIHPVVLGLFKQPHRLKIGTFGALISCRSTKMLLFEEVSSKLLRSTICHCQHNNMYKKRKSANICKCQSFAVTKAFKTPASLFQPADVMI